MDYVKITPNQFKKGLASKKNMLVFGESGIGKTATVYEYAEENGLKVVDYDLAGRLPEEVAGIPAIIDPNATRSNLKEIAKVKEQISKIEDLILRAGDEKTMVELCSLLKECHMKLDALMEEDSETPRPTKRRRRNFILQKDT